MQSWRCLGTEVFALLVVPNSGQCHGIFSPLACCVWQGELAMRGNPKAEVLVTLGGQGCMHFGSEWSPVGVAGEGGLLPHESRMGFFALGTPDSSPVDTTGAGDCFRGSYVAARYGEAKSVTEALRWAAAAGSLAVEVEGAMPSMPSRAQIEVRASNPVLYGDGDFDD
jgi:sugar/nucleoside kinase (ribokinase family)